MRSVKKVMPEEVRVGDVINSSTPSLRIPRMGLRVERVENVYIPDHFLVFRGKDGFGVEDVIYCSPDAELWKEKQQKKGEKE